MVETETTPTHELEPSQPYAIGDVVRLKHGLHPETLWLLTTPIKDTPDGLMTGGIEIDEDGIGLGVDGSILIDDIEEKVGTRRTHDEVKAIYADAFENKFGKTIPREEVIAMLERQFGAESTDK